MFTRISLVPTVRFRFPHLVRSVPVETLLKKLYEQATGHAPYRYQRRLALDPWPDIVRVPTGMGKTAALFFAWLARRLQGEAPRRLVWCLPMRALVEQTARLAEDWLQKLEDKSHFSANPRPHVYRLMGGHVDALWSTRPEDAAVVIGTQDQLLSRALNRGYAMSRYRWPMDFSLLHNDCLWVFDEVQLMGAGLPTSVQLHAFRNLFGSIFPSRSIWCSATLRKDWLNTTDFSAADLRMLELDAVDAAAKRLNVRKSVTALPALNHQEWAKRVIEEHRSGSRTLVVCNTVKSARKFFAALQKCASDAERLLLHSRFRAPDRERRLRRLLSEPGAAGCIAVTTQVVEAGVDVSAATLFTELAPWPSLVQRFGRCNRAGEREDARIFWMDYTKDKKTPSPYDDDALAAARIIMERLVDAAPAHLPQVMDAPPLTPLLRKQDFLELFDAAADISGADTDISRYIREGEERDVQVFWRDLPDGKPGADMPGPHRDELCSVPVHELQDFCRGKRRAWQWDALEGEWAEPGTIFPGMVLLLDAKSGGYCETQGWLGKDGGAAVPVLVVPGCPVPEKDEHDGPGNWQSLEDHVGLCHERMKILLNALGAPLEPWEKPLKTAARLHDWGKAHPVFQTAVKNPPPGDTLWAKAPAMQRYTRRGFRHELASALALLHSPHEEHTDLTAYLAAAHHGRVRLSIRSLPHEKAPDEVRRFARGIHEGDTLPAALGQPETRLSLAYMEMGQGPHGESWLQRMLTLLDTLGPFRLAYLETLLRVADWRAGPEQDAARPDGSAHA